MAVIEITEANFETEVLKSDVPVLVDFWKAESGREHGPGPEVPGHEHSDPDAFPGRTGSRHPGGPAVQGYREAAVRSIR